MNIANKSVGSSTLVTGEGKNANYRISNEQLYWLFFAGLGLLIGCSFVVLNFLF